MNERREELLRQRHMVAQHLAWLDREIVRAKEAPGQIELDIPLPDRGVKLEETATAHAAIKDWLKEPEESQGQAQTEKPLPSLPPELVAQGLPERPDPRAINRSIKLTFWILTIGAFAGLALVYYFWPEWEPDKQEAFRQQYQEEEVAAESGLR